MIFGRQFVLLGIALLLLPGAMCNKKKPQLPHQATAPAEPIPSPLPSEISEQTPPPPAPAPKADTEAKSTEPTQPKPKKRKPRKSSPTTTAQNNSSASPAPASSTSSSSNATIALARPPANPASEPPPDTAISADVSSAQLTQQKQTTTQLLDSTEKTLGGLPHNLPPDQEQLVVQIRAYVAQSRKATTDGDFERAYNLATKAHLLSDALVKK